MNNIKQQRDVLFWITDPMLVCVGLPLGSAACVVYRSKKSDRTGRDTSRPYKLAKANDRIGFNPTERAVSASELLPIPLFTIARPTKKLGI